MVSTDTSSYVHVPLKHWMEGSGWEMAESLFNMVQARTQKVVSATPYFFVTCNNIMTLDNQSHINIHVYTIVDWTRVLYFGVMTNNQGTIGEDSKR